MPAPDHRTAAAQPPPAHTPGDDLVQNSRAAIAEGWAGIAEADRLLVLYASHIRPLAYACATMTREAPPRRPDPASR